tara:strand:- start:394 stop:684 length:291 start_codon:yes stop_codon:yes gene_type:complete
MMTLQKTGEPNPLEYFGVREVNTYPKHFDTIAIEMTYNLEDSLRKWIRQNLKGRYYIGKSLELDNQSNYTSQLKVGFENPKELSYFMLACPHLKYR